MKVVGARQSAKTSEEALHRAGRLARHSRPRGFVFEAKTWEELENWRRAQTNLRLW